MKKLKGLTAKVETHARNKTPRRIYDVKTQASSKSPRGILPNPKRKGKRAGTPYN